MSKTTAYQYRFLGIGLVAIAIMALVVSSYFSPANSRMADKNPVQNLAANKTEFEDVIKVNSADPELEEESSGQKAAAQDTDALVHPKIKTLYDEGQLLDSVQTELHAEVDGGQSQRYLREAQLYSTQDAHFPLVLRVKILEQHDDHTLRPIFEQSAMGGHFLIRMNEGIDFEEFNNYALAQGTVLDQFGLPEGMYRVVLGNQRNASALLDAIESFDHSGYVEYADVDEITAL